MTSSPTAPTSACHPRLASFIARFGDLLDTQSSEADILQQGRALLADLVARDDWLPDAWAQPHPEHYQQFRLHVDPRSRFSVVSFVWGPGQHTPIHDHTVWGLIGMLRGSEYSQAFRLDEAGCPVPDGPETRLEPGEVEAVSPHIGDIHRVRNAHDDRTSISIHVYGADIGRVQRSVFTAEGARKRFVSGYANAGPVESA